MSNTMTKEEAYIIAKAGVRISTMLNALLLDLEGRWEPDEFKTFKLRIGNLMVSVSEDLLNPSYSKYPEMLPKNEEDWERLGELSKVRSVLGLTSR